MADVVAAEAEYGSIVEHYEEGNRALQRALAVLAEASPSEQAQMKAPEAISSELRHVETRLESAKAAVLEKEKHVEYLRGQIHSFAKENLLEPSAEKFPKQFAAASGTLAVLTAGSVALVGTMSRITDVTPVFKGLVGLGFAGILLGLAFHVPQLWIHYRDWQKAESATFNPEDEVADVRHGKAVQRFQFMIFGLQYLTWVGLAGGILGLVMAAPGA